MSEKRAFKLPGYAVALVLAGGRGKRLHELTDNRAKPAIYFGGNFRIIDFALSNCINSNIRRIGVVTQYKSHSLLRHLRRAWSFLRGEVGEFIDLLPAQQRVDEESWYRGTADAVYQNIDIVQSYRPAPEFIIVLAGDHVYKMDYAAMLVDHVEKGGECTVACIEVPRANASAFGVMAVDESEKILDFVEKPENPPCIPGKPDYSLCSMGIYIFNAKYLYSELERDIADESSNHDFGKDIIPNAVKNSVAFAHFFQGSCIHAPEEGQKEHYWRDVGTVDAYWEANIDLTTTDPALNLYDRNWPIWTYRPQLPPAKFVHNQYNRRGLSIESTIANGCIISGETNRSILFSACRIHSYARIDWSVLLPEVDIGTGARIRRAVIDHGVRIPAGMIIGEDDQEDRRRFRCTQNGIVLVTQLMVDQAQ